MTDTPLDKQLSLNNTNTLIDRDIKEQLLIKDRAIASSIHGIGITDLEGNIIYVNEAAMRMWGADDPSEIIGQSALEFAQDQEKAFMIMLEVLEKGSWEGEIEGFRKDGTPATIHMAANIVYNKKGEPICIAAWIPLLTSLAAKKWKKSCVSRILPSHLPFTESVSVIWKEMSLMSTMPPCECGERMILLKF